MCHLYIGYYQFLNDYPVFIYSGLPWTTIPNECNRWKKWLESDEAIGLPNSDYTSSSFFFLIDRFLLDLMQKVLEMIRKPHSMMS
jgi:hypothetical protein